MIPVEPQTFSNRAACKGYPTEMFFPDDRPPKSYLEALPCAWCDVKPACAEYADVNNCEGIWAGTYRSLTLMRQERFRTASKGPELSPKALEALSWGPVPNDQLKPLEGHTGPQEEKMDINPDSNSWWKS